MNAGQCTEKSEKTKDNVQYWSYKNTRHPVIDFASMKDCGAVDYTHGKSD